MYNARKAQIGPICSTPWKSSSTFKEIKYQVIKVLFLAPRRDLFFVVFVFFTLLFGRMLDSATTICHPLSLSPSPAIARSSLAYVAKHIGKSMGFNLGNRFYMHQVMSKRFICPFLISRLAQIRPCSPYNGRDECFKMPSRALSGP